MESKVYITTPIYYANAYPHIGHLFTTTAADTVARHFRLLLGNENVFFTTGLDEHGTTIEEAAKKAGITGYQEFVDGRYDFWKSAFDETNIQYDYFVRTTNPEHEKFAQDFIRRMIKARDDNGQSIVYRDKYRGKYCYGCEKFLTATDLDENGKCPNHRPDQVMDVEEENWFFRLSYYAPMVRSLIQENQLKIYPESKRNEILSRIDQGILDQSISRPKEKVDWAIPFPGDPTQTVYVWVEALINYMSSLEINKKWNLGTGEYGFWNNAIHIIGKDISWFHNLVWPSMLLAAGYPIQKATFVHSYLNLKGQKISKSLGNVITPKEVVNKYGIDGTRYVLLANTPYRDDTDVTWELLDSKYSADLVNGYGNLFSRLTKLAEHRKANISIPVYKEIFDENSPYFDDSIKRIKQGYREIKLMDIVETLRQMVAGINMELNQKEPWKKEGAEKDTMVDEFLIKLAIIAVLFEPIMPASTEFILNNIKSDKIFATRPLFNKLTK